MDIFAGRLIESIDLVNHFSHGLGKTRQSNLREEGFIWVPPGLRVLLSVMMGKLWGQVAGCESSGHITSVVRKWGEWNGQCSACTLSFVCGPGFQPTPHPD